MPDSLGWRAKFAVIAPSTNTSVQPEYDDMRPPGVTNHFSRIAIPNTKITGDDSFLDMMANIRSAMFKAVDVALSMEPQCVVLGMSAETFWDGTEGADALYRKMLDRTAGVPVILGSTALDAAIKAYGGIKKIGIITPYMPVGDANVRRFFEEQGYEIVHLVGLRSTSPVMIAHENKSTLRRAVQDVATEVDAVIQCGTNLAFVEIAAAAEAWLDLPVIAINTATYWHALRTMGIKDRMPGFGALMAEH